MKNKKKIVSLFILLALLSLTTGCGKKSELKNGNETAVTLKGIKITANEFYDKIKKNNVSQLIDMIDHKILDEKYGNTDEEKKKIKEQIEMIKSQYGSNEETYNQVLRQYFGVTNEDELKEILELEYRRTEAVNDFIEKKITKKEIEKYYKENIYGEVRASHILIKPTISETATEEDRKKAEKEALKKAEKVIEELKNGKKFDDLAKKYSDDKATATNGGDLGYFNLDEMVEEFSDATKKLEKNKYTKHPVKSEFGYHIILKKDQKDKPKLKDVKEDIIEKIRNEKLSKDAALFYQTLIDIRDEKDIKWNDSEIEKQYNKLMKQLLDSTKNTK